MVFSFERASEYKSRRGTSPQRLLRDVCISLTLRASGVACCCPSEKPSASSGPLPGSPVTRGPTLPRPYPAGVQVTTQGDENDRSHEYPDTHTVGHRADRHSAALAHLPGGCRAVHAVSAVTEATHRRRQASLLCGRREGAAVESVRRGGANRARGQVPQLVVASRPRVGGDPGGEQGVPAFPHC